MLGCILHVANLPWCGRGAGGVWQKARVGAAVMLEGVQVLCMAAQVVGNGGGGGGGDCSGGGGKFNKCTDDTG